MNEDKKVRESLINLISVGDVIKVYNYYYLYHICHMIFDVDDDIIYLGGIYYANKLDIECINGELYLYASNIRKKNKLKNNT